MMTLAEMTGDAYLDLIRRGYEKAEAVACLAARYGVRPGLIHTRLHRAKVFPPYKPRRQSIHPQNVGAIPGDEIVMRRVYRDPCPRCGSRADFGCRHGRPSGPLSVAFA